MTRRALLVFAGGAVAALAIGVGLGLAVLRLAELQDAIDRERGGA